MKVVGGGSRYFPTPEVVRGRKAEGRLAVSRNRSFSQELEYLDVEIGTELPGVKGEDQEGVEDTGQRVDGVVVGDDIGVRADRNGPLDIESAHRIDPGGA